MASVINKLESPAEQKELFLWKFPEVPREEVNSLLKDFIQKDSKHIGEIDEFSCLYILEHRGMTKTATELRQLVAEMDQDKNKLISFIELCCGIFQKPIGEINNFVDEEARTRAITAAMEASKLKRDAETEIARAKEAAELAAQIRAAAIERESKLTGVAGAAAFFSRKAEATMDATKTNAEQITEEAARRRILREAKKALDEAQNEVNKRKSAEEIAAEVKARESRTAAEEAALKKKQEDDEKAFRSARKATLNSIWSGKSFTSPEASNSNRSLGSATPSNSSRDLGSNPSTPTASVGKLNLNQRFSSPSEPQDAASP